MVEKNFGIFQKLLVGFFLIEKKKKKRRERGHYGCFQGVS